MTALAKFAASLVALVLLVLPTACAGSEQEGADPGPMAGSADHDGGDDGGGNGGNGNGGNGNGGNGNGGQGNRAESEDEGPGFIQTVVGFVLVLRDNCAETLEPGETVDVGVERLVAFVICIADQGWKVPPSMQLTLPDASHETVVAQRREDGRWQWRITPGYGDLPVDTPGTYDFVISTPSGTHGNPSTTLAPTGSSSPSPTATATGTAASSYSGRITVQPATTPRLMAPSLVQPGATVVVALAGYDAGSAVTVVVYGPGVPAETTPRDFERLAQLPSARADDHGEARVTWTAPAVTQRAIYGLWLDPLPAGCLQLCQVAVAP